MKKIICIILAAVLLCGAAFFMIRQSADRKAALEAQQAQAQLEEEAALAARQEAEDQAIEMVSIDGQIVEIGEDYVLIDSQTQGQVHVFISDDTIFEGVTRDELALGQIASILYDGKMTRSLPPQITALRVSVNALTGTVTQIEEDGRVLLTDETGNQTLLTLPEGETVQVGERLTVYTGGVMTMSLPPQMNALGVVHENANP